MAKDRRVRIYPTTEAHVPGVPAVQMLLEADLAERLLAYNPPAFTTQRPDGMELDESPRDHLDDIHLPWALADEQAVITEATPEIAAVPDSSPVAAPAADAEETV